MVKIRSIDGNNFSDLEGFYNEIDKILTKDLNWKTGHNLDAYNDLPLARSTINAEKRRRALLNGRLLYEICPAHCPLPVADGGGESHALFSLRGM